MYTSAELLMDQSKTGYGIMMAVTTVSFPPELEALQQSKGLRLSCFAAGFWMPKALDCCGHRSPPVGASHDRKYAISGLA